MTKLKRLYLNSNQLTGGMPQGLESLASLEQLDLTVAADDGISPDTNDNEASKPKRILCHAFMGSNQ